MCTVTFIPTKEGIYITSNRDEKYHRKQAIPPERYTYGDTSVICPKDADAGGSWIAMRDNGNAAVLLNGAFMTHLPTPPYRKSRGIIFLEIIAGPRPAKTFLKIDLSKIEPFTLIIFDNNELYECRWDGHKKYCVQLNTNMHHIWSSATLYTKDIVQKREKWFSNWLKKNPYPTQEEIIFFHRFAGDGDRHNDLSMNRNNSLFTVSITGIELHDEKSSMHYLDLKDNIAYTKEMNNQSQYAF